MYKVSVIIPVYNVGKYIIECLDSVIDQTLKDIEIICVDDCGTDNSMQIVEKYAEKDSRIKVIRHKKNKGLAQSRNIAMDKSTGEYIFFLDSDDSIKKNILEKLYNVAVNDMLDIVISKTFVYADSESKNSESVKERIIKIDNYLQMKTFYNRQVNFENFTDIFNEVSCVVWGRLYCRDFIEKNNLRFIQKNILHEDNGFTLKVLSSIPKITSISDIGVMYRIRTNSITENMENEKNIKKKLQHLSNSLNDAYEYINTKYDADISGKIISIAKSSGSFSYDYLIDNRLIYNHPKVNWLPSMFGIFNTKDRLTFVVFFIKITIKVTQKDIDKMAWWIPVRKWRDKFRAKFN